MPPRILSHVAVGTVAVLSTAACGLMFEDHPSIAGSYDLRQVDGNAVPCCAAPDSTDSTTTVTIVGGSLTLGDAAPEDYGYPPSGVPMAVSCVHGIPDGAWVDRNDVVHLPDGTTYQIPPCGDGPYTMIIVRRYDHVHGTAAIVADTTLGKYTWGSEAGRDPFDGGIISLLASAGIGQVNTARGGIDLLVQTGVRVGPFPPTGRKYEFVSTR